MVESFEHLLRNAARDPLASRAHLYKEILRSETYLLTIDAPLSDGEERRVAGPDSSFPVWADKDAELGGVWVPVFPARDRVREFVAARHLKAPRGKEFLWMGHMPGQVFSLLRGVQRFAGVRLYLDQDTIVSLDWAEARALADGGTPPDAPQRHDLPIEKLVIPSGIKLAFGRLRPLPGENAPVLLLMPEAGRFRPEDLRKLVKLPLAGGNHAWTPCRHFLQILRRLKTISAEGSEHFVDQLLASQLAFEMYGEAEALCEWLAARGFETISWLGLAAIFGRTARYDECAELCGRAAAKYPAERTFHVNGLRALIALGRGQEALRRADEALRIFPQDELLLGLRARLSPADAPKAA